MIFFSFQRSEKLEFQSWPFGNFGLDRLASDTSCCSAHHATPMLCGMLSGVWSRRVARGRSWSSVWSRAVGRVVARGPACGRARSCVWSRAVERVVAYSRACCRRWLPLSGLVHHSTGLVQHQLPLSPATALGAGAPQHGACSHQLPLSGLVQHRSTRHISALPAALSGLKVSNSKFLKLSRPRALGPLSGLHSLRSRGWCLTAPRLPLSGPR